MVVSCVDGGKSTDAELVNQSGFLRFLKPGDRVLADKAQYIYDRTVNAYLATL